MAADAAIRPGQQKISNKLTDFAYTGKQIITGDSFMKLARFQWALLLALPIFFSSGLTAAKTDKPNILVIWGDDFGMWNISAYHNGMMGGRTPNIDRIANEGAIFTDAYAQQRCTAECAP